MYYSRKRQQEETLTELTAIWTCTKDDCNGWIRNNFSFEAVPTCRQCQSPMIQNMREIPVLNNPVQSLR